MQQRRKWPAVAGLLLVLAGSPHAAPEAAPPRASTPQPTAPQPAPDVTAADARAVRAVIEAQLAAFAADDAQKAFSFAAPNIRGMFSTADRFMAMVRQGYPVVYRPASVTFLKPQWIDEKLVQRVQMTDAEGRGWTVAYELERQSDRSWRITACVAALGAARST